jgi:hypothetical protein
LLHHSSPPFFLQQGKDTNCKALRAEVEVEIFNKNDGKMKLVAKTD